MKAMAVVVLVLLLLAPPAVSQAPDDKLIVPGQRIGKWTLEMNIADLVRMNGPARSRTLFTAGGSTFADAVRDLTMVNWDGIVVRAMTFEDSKLRDTVVALLIDIDTTIAGWQLYKTDKRSGLESTRDQVLKAYGKPTAQTKPEPTQTNLIYDNIGIAFHVWGRTLNETMRAIFVFRPRTAKTIWKF